MTSVEVPQRPGDSAGACYILLSVLMMLLNNEPRATWDRPEATFPRYSQVRARAWCVVSRSQPSATRQAARCPSRPGLNQKSSAGTQPKPRLGLEYCRRGRHPFSTGHNLKDLGFQSEAPFNARAETYLVVRSHRCTNQIPSHV